jgi:ubiquinone/menaquinone biosynthesis C-methylase UbiE
MARHERMFRHEHAHKLDDPDRQRWLPTGAVVECLSLQPGMSVADVGAGTGYFALPIARAVVPGGQVFAVDVQPEMLARLRERLEPGLPIALVEGEATRTTLHAASVDLVFLANVWHEIDDREAALAEAARILRPGGRVAILDWRTDVEQPPGPPLGHRLAASDVQAMLGANGWKVEPSQSVGDYSYLMVATPRG